MDDMEKAELAQKLTKEMKNSSRTDVKYADYIDSFRSEMIRMVDKSSQAKALKWPRETKGIMKLNQNCLS